MKGMTSETWKVWLKEQVWSVACRGIINPLASSVISQDLFASLRSSLSNSWQILSWPVYLKYDFTIQETWGLKCQMEPLNVTKILIKVWWKENVKVVLTQKILSMLLYLPESTLYMYRYIKKQDKYFFASFCHSHMQ